MAAAIPHSLANRAYVVSGGFSGIGLATVHKLLQRSATVHVVDRADSPPPSLIQASNITPMGKVYFYPSTDVSSRPSVQNSFKSILKLTPKISGLVNSAGICPSSGGILEDDETFQRTIAVNLTGTWNVATELLRHIQKTSPSSLSGICSIVNVGSSASYYGFQTLGAYTASKHAVLGLTRTWALDFAPYGVRVNLVAPGGTRTPLSAAQFNDGERGDMSREVYNFIPMKRFAEPEELADAIVYLLSDNASYVMGQILKVNGGWP
ncbi:NAD(P)-binding protein [Hyaloscypha bicolor E]|uniref:NAD(P)-binding protein n=1 Tax=Hyaloscypha bicolor E TaxID=1095630 RepID=A0A2J6SGW3_9HELO|nr:NAD(P)-binding protein [Hyaloscypha bicolor E]PMD49989.1 NAD(P)-binding protein [Hyaloscypha bicolor E]